MVIKLKERHSDFELPVLLAFILLYLVVDNNDLIDDHECYCI